MTLEKQTWTIICGATELYENMTVTIKDDELHYLTNVLRLKIDDQIEITNTKGTKGLAKITSITKKEACLLVLNSIQQTKSLPKMSLYLALPKPTTLEEVVSFSSEIGLDELHIFRTERCVSKAPVKLEKLNRISQEALRINKSAYCTKLFNYENMNDFYKIQKAQFEQGLNFFCDESHIYENKITNTLLSVLLKNFTAQQNINFIIGPEASFSQNERDFIHKNLNCHCVSLGNNILRVPNAVACALAVATQFTEHYNFNNSL